MVQLGARPHNATTTKLLVRISLFFAFRKIPKGKLMSTGTSFHKYITMFLNLFLLIYKVRKTCSQTLFIQINFTENFRSTQWLLNCERHDLLGKDANYLYNNCKLCAAHFTPSCFRNMSRTRLHEHAIPTIFSIKRGTMQKNRENTCGKWNNNDGFSSYHQRYMLL